MSQTINLRVEGMNCASCAASIEKFLKNNELQDAYVNFSTCEVRYNTGNTTISEEEVKKAIRNMGYVVVEKETPPPFWTVEKKFWFCLPFTLPLLLNHLLMTLGVHWAFMHHAWVQFALALPVYLIGIEHFGKSAFHALKNGSTNMDVLIFLGSTAAFVYSLVGLFTGNDSLIFFETSSSIVTLVLLGNLIEKKAIQSTTSAIESLTHLQAPYAQKVLADGSLQQIALADIAIGDVLHVNEGDKIPADGAVISGEAWVDESMLTGESLPVSKEKNSKVVGASVLKSGNFRMKVSATGNSTTLQRMIDMVKMAQAEKPDIQRIADRISTIFVPVVTGISLLTFVIGWAFFFPFAQALMNAIAVLVISCPCAMGLATPTAIMVGVGRAAKQGILIKGGQTLEILGAIQQMVFDKTGTLTEGNFKVHDIVFYTEEKEKALKILSTLAQYSSHPISKALAKHFPLNDFFYFKNVGEKKGMGMEGLGKNGEVYQMGSYKMVADLTKDESFQVYLRENDKLLAAIRLDDMLKEDAKDAVSSLQKMGIQTTLLSGDVQSRANQMGKQVGISHILASQTPEQKLTFIAESSQKQATAMVGDGINDAPALAKATIGISMSNASQIAVESAQVILLNGKLQQLPFAVALSRATLSTIKQSLWWAAAYNVVAIPLAAMGLLTPMWGAIFMAFSDLVVIGNSVRLGYRKIGGK